MEVLTGPERRRRWTAEQKLAMVRESLEPGKSVSEHRFALGVESDDVEHGLPDIDAHAGDRSRALLAHGTPPRMETGAGPDYAITGGADHPING